MYVILCRHRDIDTNTNTYYTYFEHPFNICKQRTKGEAIYCQQNKTTCWIFIYFFLSVFHSLSPTHSVSFWIYLHLHASSFSFIYRFYLPNGKVGLQHTQIGMIFVVLFFRSCFIRHHILLVLFLLLLKAQINTIWHYLFSFYFTSLYCCFLRSLNSHFSWDWN